MVRKTTEPKHFSAVPSNATWSSIHKLQFVRFMLDKKKQLNTTQVVQYWIRTPEEGDLHPWRSSSPGYMEPLPARPSAGNSHALDERLGWRLQGCPSTSGTNCPILTARPGVATCSVVPDALLQTAGDPLSSSVGPGDRDRWEGHCVTPLNPLRNVSLVRHT